MRRRNVIAGLAALPFRPIWASAQQATAKIPRVGIATAEESERAPKFDAFRAGLRDLGYIEGRNIILEFRFARGDPSRGRN
jgi:putative ABC transport system substrate-binding protein